MCPLRFLLVFFSAILAGYFAWRSLRFSPEDDDLTGNGDSGQEKAPESSKDEKNERNMRKVMQDGFWVFVDMASGKYLWRNYKEMKNKDEKVQSS